MLGAKPLHEITVQNVLVRTFQVGDMIVELLRPGPYSSLADAETGAVAFVRARGFRAFDPELGPQVDTLVTSLQAKETAGLRFSLFQRL